MQRRVAGAGPRGGAGAGLEQLRRGGQLELVHRPGAGGGRVLCSPLAGPTQPLGSLIQPLAGPTKPVGGSYQARWQVLPRLLACPARWRVLPSHWH